MKKARRIVALLVGAASIASAQDQHPCAEPSCEGEGGGGSGGGSCTNIPDGTTERFAYTVFMPPSMMRTCYYVGNQIRVECRNAEGQLVSSVTVVVWTNETRCYNSF